MIEKKEKLLELIEVFNRFRLCGPSDDPDEQTGVVYSLKDLIKKFKYYGKYINNVELRNGLLSIDDAIEDIYDAYDAYSDLSNIVEELESYLDSSENTITYEFLNPFEWVQLIESIACELQKTMITTDINTFLITYNITFLPQDTVQSKRTYVKSILQNVQDQKTVIKIAEDLGLRQKNQLVQELELKKINNNYINQQIMKCNKKIQNGDYDGAITNARTLIETVCLHILDESNVEYKDDGNLMKLHKSVAKILNMLPQNYQEDSLKQICSGFISIVNGISCIRNDLSDAHGRGKLNNYKVESRHAILAVNSSKTITEFLLASWLQNINNDKNIN
ncbi:abortive infection family protein [Vallitalea okinawensis]|uniref:abortive infection family protein n=1 Tax=Vallitalea okinawensis TaxID=2078660 RepID=UPI000CFBB594|nr:abortive infection family protein [Vallitalea okinawensis]